MTTPPDGGETPIEQRVDRLESGQQSLSDKLDEILSRLTGGGPAVSHDQAQQQTEDRLDRPSSVAEQVRAELARAAKEQNDVAERETIAQRLARLEETKPEPPQPRREKVMWGGR